MAARRCLIEFFLPATPIRIGAIRATQRQQGNYAGR
jgi:hypothetical protein